MPSPTELARAMHALIEPFHAVTYFAQECRDAWERLGLEPLVQGYVAGRAAPLGAVDPAPVTAIFYNFSPAMVEMGLPHAWAIVSPAQVLAARAEGVQACLEQLLEAHGGPPVDEADVEEATALAERAMDGVFLGGRPLAAGNARVPRSGLPLADLWQACGTLREHRGDGHVALLTTAGLTPVEALLLHAGWQDEVSERFLQRSRLWDDEAWQAGRDGLQDRGFADADGLTPTGVTFREELERGTDDAAAAPWRTLGEDGTRRLWDLLHPVAAAAAAGFPKPTAVPDTMPV